MSDAGLREQRDAALGLLGRLIRRGRELSAAGPALSVDHAAEMRIWQNDCAVAVNEFSGGSKAHWLSRAYSNALLVRSTDGGALVSANPADIVERIVLALEQAAHSLADLDAAGSAAAAAQTTPRRFDFVHDAQLRPVLEQALVESGRAMEEGDYERALKTTSGIIEALLTDALRLARPEPFDSPLILSLSKDERLAQDRLVEGSDGARGFSRASFDERIAAAEAAGLIRGGCARLPAVARAYRDDTSDVAITERDARIARQVLQVVMRDLDPGR